MAKTLPQSPLAPKNLAELPPIKGVRLATSATEIKYKGRDDLLFCVLDKGSTVAGVLTTSKTCSAPVDLCRENLKTGKVRAIVVNASNANAFTGKAGVKTVQATIREACKVVGCQATEIYVASTGVIGERLDPVPITSRLSGLNENAGGSAWMAAARA